MSHDEPDLAALFAELRAHDRVRTPAFDALIASATARAAPNVAARRVAALRVAAAAVLVCAAAGAAALLLRRSGRPAPVPVAIASWRSPTAFLLRVPGEEILRSVPNVSASVVRLEALSAEPRTQ